MELPKRLGGLGVKNLYHYNSAFLAKLAWEMIHNSDQPWVQVLQSKYFKFYNLKEDPPPPLLNLVGYGKVYFMD